MGFRGAGPRRLISPYSYQIHCSAAQSLPFFYFIQIFQNWGSKPRKLKYINAVPRERDILVRKKVGGGHQHRRGVIKQNVGKKIMENRAGLQIITTTTKPSPDDL